MPTFQEVANLYIESRSPSSFDRKLIERLSGSAFGSRDIAEIKPMHVYSLANAIYPDGKASTRNRGVIAPCSAILNFAVSNEMRIPIRLKRFAEESPAIRRPHNDVIEMILSHTKGEQHLLLLFLFNQGWRISETLTLTWEYVDMENRTLTVYVRKVKKWKTVPMHIRIYEAFAELPRRNANEHVFHWTSRHSVYNWLTPLCARLGIRFTPHMARHAFASALGERARATARDIRDLGTWTHTSSVERYCAPTAAHIRDLLSSI